MLQIQYPRNILSSSHESNFPRFLFSQFSVLNCYINYQSRCHKLMKCSALYVLDNPFLPHYFQVYVVLGFCSFDLLEFCNVIEILIYCWSGCLKVFFRSSLEVEFSRKWRQMLFSYYCNGFQNMSLKDS